MALIVKDEEIVGTINDIHSTNGIGLHNKDMKNQHRANKPSNRMQQVTSCL